jgi:purine nucleosidase
MKPLFALALALLLSTHLHAQVSIPQPVIIDTDVGDDIDDAFALGLALSSPDLKILGITSAWGNTQLRARLLDRLLTETGHTDIPVAVGIEAHHKNEGGFSQSRWAERQPARPHPQAVDFLLQQIKAHPNQITLIGIGPLTNVAAAFERDPATFRKLKRIVIMGGSVRKGYGDKAPMPEYNIAMDPAAAGKVFTAGVPLYVMPLDSTQISLDEPTRLRIFTQSKPLTDALALLYLQWSGTKTFKAPTLYDPVAVAYAIDPTTCPTTPLRLSVDATGNTREEPGTPNTFVCLTPHPAAFFQLYLHRVLGDSQPSTP